MSSRYQFRDALGAYLPPWLSELVDASERSEPQITSIAPATGPGGTALTILGTDFRTGAVVRVGGVLCTSIVVVGLTQITCVAPAGTAGAKDVTVTNPDGGSDTMGSGFTYPSAPASTVSSIAPTSGSTAGGTAVTITGTNFTGATGAAVGGVALTSFTVVNATTITGVTGARAAGAVDVTVTGPGGTGTLLAGFTYVASAPTVSSVAPNIGKLAGGGALRTITGTNFTGATGVTFDGTPATSVTVVNATTITCVPPAGSAGPADVAVTGPGGTGMGVGVYEYWDPEVEALSVQYRQPNYTTGPATFAPTTGATNLTQTTAPAPAAVGGAPDCEALTDFPLGAALDVNTLAPDPVHTVFAVIDTETIRRVNANPWSNDGLVADSLSNFGLFLRATTTIETAPFFAQFYEWDGANKNQTVDITSLVASNGAGKLAVMGKKDGGSLFVRAANASTTTGWGTGVACGNLTASAGNLRLGSAGGTPDGIVKCIGIATTAWDNTIADKFERWARAELF